MFFDMVDEEIHFKHYVAIRKINIIHISMMNWSDMVLAGHFLLVKEIVMTWSYQLVALQQFSSPLFKLFRILILYVVSHASFLKCIVWI